MRRGRTISRGRSSAGSSTSRATCNVAAVFSTLKPSTKAVTPQPATRTSRDSRASTQHERGQPERVQPRRHQHGFSAAGRVAGVRDLEVGNREAFARVDDGRRVEAERQRHTHRRPRGEARVGDHVAAAQAARARRHRAAVPQRVGLDRRRVLHRALVVGEVLAPVGVRHPRFDAHARPSAGRDGLGGDRVLAITLAIGEHAAVAGDDQRRARRRVVPDAVRLAVDLAFHRAADDVVAEGQVLERPPERTHQPAPGDVHASRPGPEGVTRRDGERVRARRAQVGIDRVRARRRPRVVGIQARGADAAAQQVELSGLHRPVGVAVEPVVRERRDLAPEGIVEADLVRAERARERGVADPDRRSFGQLPGRRQPREEVHPAELRWHRRRRPPPAADRGTPGSPPPPTAGCDPRAARVGARR